MPGTRQISVRALSRSATRGHLAIGNVRFPCALGRSGTRALKREGDGASPGGRWKLQAVLFRRDRRRRPGTGLPVRPIRHQDGWCDAPADRNYNKPVTLPYPASCERMWRDDALYDLVVVLDHNQRPRRRQGGSAIFMHVARPGYLPTEGCIALKAADLARVLSRLRRGATIKIG